MQTQGATDSARLPEPQRPEEQAEHLAPSATVSCVLESRVRAARSTCVLDGKLGGDAQNTAHVPIFAHSSGLKHVAANCKPKHGRQRLHVSESHTAACQRVCLPSMRLPGHVTAQTMAMDLIPSVMNKMLCFQMSVDLVSLVRSGIGHHVFL